VDVTGFHLGDHRKEQIMSDQTLGKKVGDVIAKVKETVNETTDRARAEAHDTKAEVTNNPIERAAEKVKATVDRAKADVHKSNADAHDDPLKK
jgi:F0F1-type ATP synthase membrane subunit b/b'